MSSRFCLALLLFGYGSVQAQLPPPAADPPVPQAGPEISTKDEQATFRSRVNLVMVPVVVRDKQGKIAGTLRQEDFQLFDRGKPQVITRFSVENAGARRGEKAEAKPGAKAIEPGEPVAPERYIAYLFDDIHLAFGDLARARDAAAKQMATMAATDRAAIFTTSGQVNVEFTDDRDELETTLNRLMPRPMQTRTGAECPDLGFYQADRIIRGDAEALRVAIEETLVCASLDPTRDGKVAESMARSAASQVTTMATHETRVTLYTLRDAVRRMAAAPGQRIIVLTSSGFLAPEQQAEKTDIMDRAIRASVVINSLDARGLWTDPVMDASRRGPVISVMNEKNRYDRDTASRQADVLAEMAAGTGGAFWENNNDIAAGFQKLASMPEYVYLLGFSPQNLKLDGSFHALKVSLKTAGLSANARKGYYAPKQLDDAAETARREIEEAVFSREEVRELPIDLSSQFFKPGDAVARVSMLAHIDLKNLHFRKAEGRNYNTLVIVSAVFDRNGNYVTGNKKTLEMRLRDETLANRAEAGITVRSAFDVKPGVYLVRLVVRDAEGQLMTAQNGALDIPK